MEANVLFGKALGLGSGWKVVKSEMDVGRELKIWLDFESGSQFACPRCGKFSRLAIATLRRSMPWHAKGLLRKKIEPSIIILACPASSASGLRVQFHATDLEDFEVPSPSSDARPAVKDRSGRLGIDQSAETRYKGALRVRPSRAPKISRARLIAALSGLFKGRLVTPRSGTLLIVVSCKPETRISKPVGLTMKSTIVFPHSRASARMSLSLRCASARMTMSTRPRSQRLLTS
jgi:hypothetical protein